ncbi:MAG: hypothetical protein WAM60_08635 [Candidatus Promineifilaceae bacterium]
MQTNGKVTLTKLPQGQARVTITIQTVPPDNLTESVTASLFKDNCSQLDKDLHRFKAYIEKGDS